jgi:hypothetical protein
MTDLPGTARDSVASWLPWGPHAAGMGVSPSTGARASLDAQARSAEGDDADGPHGRRRSAGLGGAVIL